MRPHRLTPHRAVLVVVALTACCLLVSVPGASAKSTTTTTPSKTTTPTTTTVPAPVRVLVMGDSQAGTLTFGAPLGQGPHGLSAQPGLTIADRTILGCAISSVPTFVLDSGEQTPNRCGGAGVWQQRWAAALSDTPTDAVFLMAGDNDMYDVAGADGTVVHPGEPAWTTAYTADVVYLFRLMRSGGAALVAVKPPPCFGQNTLTPDEPAESARLDPARASVVTAAWQSAARTVGIKLLDLDAGICPGGASDPAVRADGVHFTAVGADRLAPEITRTLRKAVVRDRAADQGNCPAAKKRAATSVGSC